MQQESISFLGLLEKGIFSIIKPATTAREIKGRVMLLRGLVVALLVIELIPLLCFLLPGPTGTQTSTADFSGAANLIMAVILAFFLPLIFLVSWAALSLISWAMSKILGGKAGLAELSASMSILLIGTNAAIFIMLALETLLLNIQDHNEIRILGWLTTVKGSMMVIVGIISILFIFAYLPFVIYSFIKETTGLSRGKALIATLLSVLMPLLIIGSIRFLMPM